MHEFVPHGISYSQWQLLETTCLLLFTNMGFAPCFLTCRIAIENQSIHNWSQYLVTNYQLD